MKSTIVVFPGSNGERDIKRALSETIKTKVNFVWHDETSIPLDTDLLILPGGSAFGDYLRAGAIAAKSPIMKAVKEHAEKGKMLLGICNGFQILTEAKLLPGSLISNVPFKFICKKSFLKVEQTNNMFTSKYRKGEITELPIAHSKGLYFLPESELQELEDSKQVVFRYADPVTGDSGAGFASDGSLNGIAGICNKEGNILGLMPHPERASFSHLVGGNNGISFWKSIAAAFKERGVA